MADYLLHQGDAREWLKAYGAGMFNCCVTSPPYFGLRDYGVQEQIGTESDPNEYIANLVDVFRCVRESLTDDGTLWLNIGDSYATTGGAHGGRSDNQPGVGVKRVYTAEAADKKARNPPSGLKSKDLIGIPWLLAFALRADGWYLRQDIIWHKPNPMPESVRDRCTKAHEYLFLLTKSPKYYFDHKAMQEPAVKDASGRSSTKPRTAGNKNHKYVTAYEASDTEEHRTKAGLMKIADMPWETRNRRSVWTIATRPFKGAHFAVFPEALIEPCILAGSPAGGWVVDPFSGSGTTVAVANRLGRNAVGIDLNAEYVAMAERRM